VLLAVIPVNPGPSVIRFNYEAYGTGIEVCVIAVSQPLHSSTEVLQGVSARPEFKPTVLREMKHGFSVVGPLDSNSVQKFRIWGRTSACFRVEAPLLRAPAANSRRWPASVCNASSRSRSVGSPLES
jgi:hypothetical protein